VVKVQVRLRLPRIVTAAEHEELIHPCGVKPRDADCDPCLKEQQIACLCDHILDIDIPKDVDPDDYLRFYCEQVHYFVGIPPWKKTILTFLTKHIRRLMK